MQLKALLFGAVLLVSLALHGCGGSGSDTDAIEGSGVTQNVTSIGAITGIAGSGEITVNGETVSLSGASIDIDHAAEDGTKRVICPLLVLWGERGSVGRLEPVMDLWREKAGSVTGKSLPAGHFLPEEVPEETLSALLEFLGRA